MELDLNITLILVISGVIVGIINTLAGGGSVVSVTMFTALGLPITIANGTNRIAVFLQNLTSTITFLRKGMFNLKHGLLLSIPVIVGNIAGSLVATHIDEDIFAASTQQCAVARTAAVQGDELCHSASTV